MNEKLTLIVKYDCSDQLPDGWKEMTKQEILEYFQDSSELLDEMTPMIDEVLEPPVPESANGQEGKPTPISELRYRMKSEPSAVPDKPGWWWRKNTGCAGPLWRPIPINTYRGRLVWNGCMEVVIDDGLWGGECHPPKWEK